MAFIPYPPLFKAQLAHSLVSFFPPLSYIFYIEMIILQEVKR